MKTENFLKTLKGIALTGLSLLVLSSPAIGKGIKTMESGTKKKANTESAPLITQSSAAYTAEIENRMRFHNGVMVLNEFDRALRLEAWMFDLKNFPSGQRQKGSSRVDTVNGSTDSSGDTGAMVLPETERPMEVENWMKDTALFPCRTHVRGMYGYVAEF